MRRWKACVAACFALAMLGSATLATQASADRSDCPSGWVCLWDGPTFGTDMQRFRDNGFQSLAGPVIFWNDRASSAYNHTNRWAAIYRHNEVGSLKRCIAPESWSEFWGHTLNNEASGINISPDPNICNGSI